MARILHVSNFSLKAKGAYQHGVHQKISNGLIRNGHFVVNFGDRDVARASALFGHRKFGKAGANRALLALCRDMGPDLLLFGHADVILPETVAQLRADHPSLRVAQWNVDPLFEPDNIRRIESKITLVDVTLVSTAGPMLDGLRASGHRVEFLPNPVDYSIESGTNHLHESLPFDFFYACGNPHEPLRTICGRDWRMDDFVQAILDGAPGLRPFLAGLMGRPHVWGGAYQKALESAAVGLNVSRRNDVPLYTSDRVAHLIGNGQVVLIERASGYDRLFSDDQLAFFLSLEELIDHLRLFTADPRRRMAVAAAGRARYHALFNERIVAAYITDMAFDRADPAGYPWSAAL